MRKLIILLSVLFSFQSIFSQENSRKSNPHIDSLMRTLPKLKGTEKVDCLNELTTKLIDLPLGSWKAQADTARPYAKEAHKEAKQLGYKKGLGYSYMNLQIIDCMMYGVYAQGQNKFDNDLFNSSQENAHKAISIGEELNEIELLAKVYWTQAWLLTETKDNQKRADATNHLKKSLWYYEKIQAENTLARGYRWLSGLHARSFNFESAIETLEKAIFYYQKKGDEVSVFLCYKDYCTICWSVGDFENGFEVAKKAVQLTQKLQNRKNEFEFSFGQSLFWMSQFYKTAGDYNSAMEVLWKAKAYINESQVMHDVWFGAMGDLHRLIGNYDSALFYVSRFITQQDRSGVGLKTLIEVYIDLKEYDKAFSHVNVFMDRANRGQLPIGGAEGKGTAYSIAAKAYFGKKDYSTALRYARNAVPLLQQEFRVKLMDNLKLLSDLFYSLKNYDSAYFYQTKYYNLKDSILSRQFFWKLNNYKKEVIEEKRTGQIKLLEKDNLIKAQQLQQEVLLREQSEAQLSLLDKDNKIKDQQLKLKEQELSGQVLLKEQKQSQVSLLDQENRLKSQQLKQQAFVRNALISGLLLFLLLGLFITRTLLLKRKNEKLRLEKNIEMQQLASEKKHAELQQQAVELEMQALRAQMNPHFIFNCLSSINRFIFKNDNKVASDYLTRFSRLIRMVLMHSRKKLIPLEDELEMLRLYLELERLRFKEAFDYSITTTNIADPGSIFIPPLLLQPFCENAVWHGLMNKDSKGHLNIVISGDISGDNKVLRCDIEDDGVGREKAAILKSKSAASEKSLGLKITTERLALLNQENDFRTFYKIEDILDDENEVAGTRVRVKMKYKESIEELA